VNIDQAQLADAATISRLHGACFVRGWSERDVANFLASPGAIALIASTEKPVGFVLARLVLDEAELVSIGVCHAGRRSGVGRALVERLRSLLGERGVRVIFLEVAADNASAIALYGQVGFRSSSRRSHYYPRENAAPIDAIVMRLDLPWRAPCGS